jgi:L-alanine-DL-glutamate epimerase-like enolase superfamily enzyme
VPSAAWVEYIPQLDAVASNRLVIEGGCAEAPDAPGLGIEWRIDEIQSRALDPRRIDARA